MITIRSPHRHRFDLIVRDEDHRRLELIVELDELAPHRRAQSGVKIRQRFIEQEHLGVSDDGAPQGDALAVPA